jgi:hypothetical protein
MAKTWQQKFDNGRTPVLESIDKDWAGIPAGEKFLISTPKEIDAYIRQIPKGKAVSFATMKRDLALEHGTEHMCPLTAGIFTRIVSELAYEQISQGMKEEKVAPFWRVVDLKMPLAKKLSFGTDFIRQKREEEGLAV